MPCISGIRRTRILILRSGFGSFGRQQMVVDMVFKHFSHEAVDSASHIREQHEDVRAVFFAC